MNKNKKIIKLGTVGLAAVTAISIGAGSVTLGRTNPALAETTKKEQSTESAKEIRKEKKETKKGNTKNQLFKQESVYINADASGAVTKITVSDWLKNAGIVPKLIDMSELNNITNIKGDETFHIDSDNSLTWNTDGADIYYQGESNKQLPVTMNITYKLDGKEMSPEELLGKNGKVEIHISYTNHSKEQVKIGGKKTEIYTPFAMVSGIILPTEHFSNVTIDNGTLLSDGSRNIAVGIAFPGLLDSLDINSKKKIDLPEDITITADTTDFEMESTITLATADLMSKLGIDDMDSMDELKDAIEKLSDASKELADGTNELADGVDELKSKTGDFTEGIHTMTDGISKLSGGTTNLQDGIIEYTKGADTLSNGVIQYVDGVSSLANGVKSYTSGAKTLSDGIDTLADSVSELPEKLTELSNGFGSLADGLTKMADSKSIESLKNGADAIADGVGNLNSGLAEVEGGVGRVNEGLSNLEQSYSNNEAIIAQLEQIEQETTDEQTRVGLQQTIAVLQQLTDTQKDGVTSLQQATSESSELVSGIQALAENTADGSPLKEGAAALKGGIQKLVLGSSALTAAVPQLQEGTEKLTSAAKALPAAMQKLQNGANELVSNNGELNDGANSLLSAGEQLKSGATTLSGNSSQLVSGVNSLQSAVGQLQEGGTELSDGSKKLTDGVTELYEGAIKLKDGMNEFDETGIQELKATLEDEVEGLINRLQTICDSSANYKNFSGLAEEMDGSVKFILETEGIKKE